METKKPAGPPTNVTRRQLVAVGAAGVAGAIVSRGPMSGRALAQESRLGGIHIHVTTEAVYPPPPTDGFVHTFIVTLWGPDDALTGMGCGYTEEGANAFSPLGPEAEEAGGKVQTLIGTGYFGCVFGGKARVEGDVVKATAVMMYAGDPDEKRGMPFTFEANLSTGFCHFADMNYGNGTELVFEGYGTVTRI
jgi:hypothetical protein